MSTDSTIECFDKFEILLYVLGLNRYHLKYISKHKIVTYLAFVIVKAVHLFMILYAAYVTYTDPNTSITVTLFQYCVSIEWLYLILFPSGSGKLFNAIEKLDEKSGIDDEYFKQMRKKVDVVFYASLWFVILDNLVVYMFVEQVNYIVVLVVCLSTAAHEAELLFYGLLLECVSRRQGRLQGLPVPRAMTEHRYILVMTEQLNGCFNVEAFVLLAGALVTTFIYIVQIFIANPTILLKLALYLSWRELKSLYCLWFTCAAAARGEAGCRELAFKVACRAAEYGHQDGICKPEEYQLLRRWHRFLVSETARPCAGDSIILELGVPLKLLQVSATYLIIFVQIYREY